MEFYAASEGNCTLVNITSKTGACGFVPLVNSLVPVLPTKLIRIDNAMNPIRDEKGFCVETRPGEKGLLVGIIGKSTKTAFNGYANNSQASNKKVIEDLFKKGQRAFNSGREIYEYSLHLFDNEFNPIFLKLFIQSHSDYYSTIFFNLSSLNRINECFSRSIYSLLNLD